jgi:hypothetical protein
MLRLASLAVLLSALAYATPLQARHRRPVKVLPGALTLGMSLSKAERALKRPRISYKLSKPSRYLKGKCSQGRLMEPDVPRAFGLKAPNLWCQFIDGRLAACHGLFSYDRKSLRDAAWKRLHRWFRKRLGSATVQQGWSRWKRGAIWATAIPETDGSPPQHIIRFQVGTDVVKVRPCPRRRARPRPQR